METGLAGFVRWGRFSLNGRGGFAARPGEEPASGAEYELVQRGKLRSSVSLRIAEGRKESKSPQLLGTGDVDSTLRLRLGASYPIAHHWSLRLGISPALGGKSLGTQFDLGVGRSWALSDARRLDFGFSLSGGDRAFMRTWHGISPAQAPASGYPVYDPSAGLRQWRASISLRQELGQGDGGFFGGRWAAFATGTLGQMIGQAARSPLTSQSGSWQLAAGLARRF
jgi:MipA family protein